MGLGKMDELIESSTALDSLVYEKIIKGPGRTIASLITCVLLLMYYLEIENSSSASPSLAIHVFLPTLNFAALHLFAFLVFHEQRFSAFFQDWGTLLIPLFDVVSSFFIAYVNFCIISTPRQYVNWRLVLFALSYATFHFLLVINEIRGENFKLARSCLATAFLLVMYIPQRKTFAPIVCIVSGAIFYFKEYHTETTQQQKSKGAADSVLKQQRKVHRILSSSSSL